jgi:hypothetical protein
LCRINEEDVALVQSLEEMKLVGLGAEDVGECCIFKEGIEAVGDLVTGLPVGAALFSIEKSRVKKLLSEFGKRLWPECMGRDFQKI